MRVSVSVSVSVSVGVSVSVCGKERPRQIAGGGSDLRVEDQRQQPRDLLQEMRSTEFYMKCVPIKKILALKLTTQHNLY